MTGSQSSHTQPVSTSPAGRPLGRIRQRRGRPGSLLPSEGGTPRGPICHTDESGAPDAACWDMALDQYQRGYMLGYEQGARRVEHDVDQSVRRIMASLRASGWGDPL